MNASLQAIRAITGVYFQKLVAIGAVIGGLFFAALWTLLIWLTTKDGLWALFFVVLVPATIVFVFLVIMLWTLGQSVVPRKLKRAEKKTVAAIGSKLISINDTVRAPWFVSVFLIGKDVVRGRESAYIRTAIANTSGIKDDFMRVRRIFE